MQHNSCVDAFLNFEICPDQPMMSTCTLADEILTNISSNPEALVIESSAQGRSVRTLAELHQIALRIAAQIQRPPNPTSAVLVFDSVLDYIPALWACVFTGLDFLSLQRPRTKGRKAAQLSSLVVHLERPQLITTQMLANTLGERDLYSRVCTIEALTSNTGFEFSAPSREQRFFIATSGTTSAPKIIELSATTVLARLTTISDGVRPKASINIFPFDSLTGMQIAWNKGVYRTCYLQPDHYARDPVEALRLIEDFAIERLSLTSSLAAWLSDALDRGGAYDLDLQSLKQIGFGAEMIVADPILRLGHQLKTRGASKISITLGYGMTEAGLVSATDPVPLERFEQLYHHAQPPISVGRCTPSYQLRIAPNSDMVDGSGEIELFSSTKLFTRYLGAPEATKACFTSDGWFKTGDLGRIEGDSLIVTGRKKSTLIVHGRKIALEAIEAELRKLPSLAHGTFSAVSLRSNLSVTDELAVFFTPPKSTNRESLCRDIIRRVMNTFGAKVSHLVALLADDFPRTASGKIRREELAIRFLAGCWPPLLVSLQRATNAGSGSAITSTERSLTELWISALKLKAAPGLDENFYDLGGDSLSSAELIFGAEEKFGCEIPIEEFFRNPTIFNMASLLDALPKSKRAASGSVYLLRTLRSFTVSWPGQRLVPDGIITSLNATGSKPPIYWVFQEQSEFVSLAAALGPEQPIYAMRSLVGIVPIKEYTRDVLDVVTTEYAHEMLALPPEQRFYVGGNCQGGIMALALARRLKQAGRRPDRLILMEWNFSYGRYEEPTLMLYGRDSHTAKIDAQGSFSVGANWRADFPSCEVYDVPGRHGEFFNVSNCGGLAATIATKLS
ncbi:MAG: phosphopantetheine-binding protein [Hyphomicrobium sp.]